MKKFKDDEITVIESDLKKMMTRPTMYIAFLGDKGVLHLCKELIDNGRDECFKKESPGDTIDIEITNKWIRCRDNGRGIPTKLLRIVHETNQAGSNMTRSGGETAGENGTGTTAYTAMASHLEVTTLRPSEKKKLTLVYENAELVSETLEDYDGDDHGLITTFAPSKKVLGTDQIPIDMLVEWLEAFNYTLPKNINLNYTVNGEKHSIKHKKLEEFFDNAIPKESQFCDILKVECNGNLDEEVLGKKYKRKFAIEACLVYSDPNYKSEDIRQSWMNMINTWQHGSHMNGVINGFTQLITDKAIKKNKKIADVKDFKKDIVSHLNVVVKASCDMANMFESQGKAAVFPITLKNVIQKAVYTKLEEMSQGCINDMVDIALGNYRARIEGEKARDINKLARETKSWTKPDSFLPCSSIKTEQGKELFLVEGLSAGGGLRGGRNAKFQAVLQFRGKSLNTWDHDIDQILKSEPWLNLVKILGCGIGPTFNIKKINYDKIIIATDADIDGFHIRVGFLSFFAKYMPEIIEEGRLFVAEPPLYQLGKGKNAYYVANQQEYIEECINSIGNIEINFPEK